MVGNSFYPTLSLPKNYISHRLPQEVFGRNVVLFGTKEDLDAEIDLKEAKVDFSKAKSGIFQIRYSPNVTYDFSKKTFVVGGGVPIEKEVVKAGMKISFIKEKVKPAPAIFIQGTLKNKFASMNYIYNPIDNLALFITFHTGSGSLKADRAILNTFTEHLLNQ